MAAALVTIGSSSAAGTAHANDSQASKGDCTSSTPEMRAGRVSAASSEDGDGLGAGNETQSDASGSEQPWEAGLGQHADSVAGRCQHAQELPSSVDGLLGQPSSSGRGGDHEGLVRELVHCSTSGGLEGNAWEPGKHSRRQQQDGWWRRWLVFLFGFSGCVIKGREWDRLHARTDQGQGQDASDRMADDGMSDPEARGAICRTSTSASAVQADGDNDHRSRRRKRSIRGAPSKRRRARECRRVFRAGIAEHAQAESAAAGGEPSEVRAVVSSGFTEVESGITQPARIESEELCEEVMEDEAEGEDGASESRQEEGRRIGQIEVDWRGPRARRLGDLEAHVRFLQWAFRATSAVRPGCWKAGSLQGPFRVASAWGRRHVVTRCGGGAHLATDEEFAAQRRLGEEMLDWYSIYPALLRRLESGVTPFCIQNFCGGGGASEGCRRAGGACHGLDAYEQPDYCRRFGDEAFTQVDGMSWSAVKTLRDQKKADFTIGGLHASSTRERGCEARRRSLPSLAAFATSARRSSEKGGSGQSRM